jgi:hypothetical protein
MYTSHERCIQHRKQFVSAGALSFATRCGCTSSKKRSLEGTMAHHTDRAHGAARRRAKRILDIKPGTVTVYTA